MLCREEQTRYSSKWGHGQAQSMFNASEGNCTSHHSERGSAGGPAILGSLGVALAATWNSDAAGPRAPKIDSGWDGTGSDQMPAGSGGGG